MEILDTLRKKLKAMIHDVETSQTLDLAADFLGKRIKVRTKETHTDINGWGLAACGRQVSILV